MIVACTRRTKVAVTVTDVELRVHEGSFNLLITLPEYPTAFIPCILGHILLRICVAIYCAAVEINVICCREPDITPWKDETPLHIDYFQRIVKCAIRHLTIVSTCMETLLTRTAGKCGKNMTIRRTIVLIVRWCLKCYRLTSLFQLCL